MVEYKCNKCHKKFNHKGNYEKHINKINNCILPQGIILNNENICVYCNNEFTRNYDLKRHQLSGCKNKHIYDLEQKMLEQQKLIETIVKLQSYKQQPLSNDQSINNNSKNNNNHSFNTQNITINVAAYGKEDLSHITDDDYKKIFKLCNSSVPEFIKLKHFDKDHPENSNVYIPNLTGTHGFMYDGEQWTAIDKQKLINYLYDDNCDILIDKYNILKEQYNKGNLGKFDNFIDKHENDEVIKDTNRMIELIAYNYKEMAKQNRKINKN
jgi:hypothetical protein